MYLFKSQPDTPHGMFSKFIGFVSYVFLEMSPLKKHLESENSAFRHLLAT